MEGPTPTSKEPQFVLKLCLAGDFQVGKTCLMRRFISNTFDDRYVATLGAKVASKVIEAPDPDASGARVLVGATIWDIMGNPGFRELLKDAYFHGVMGMLLVCDATRPETLENLSNWHKTATSIAGEITIVVLLNKVDVGDAAKVTAEDMNRFCLPRGWPWLPTSAKSGENVDLAFTKLAGLCVASARKARRTRTT